MNALEGLFIILFTLESILIGLTIGLNFDNLFLLGIFSMLLAGFILLLITNSKEKELEK